jgi:HAD superfamily hydrolase (TIGR01509 family)
MPLRAIVFDFDGVIANSEPLHFRGYRDVLAQERIALTEHDYYAHYLGFDDVGAFEAIGRRHGAAWSRERIRDLVSRKAVRLEELERDVSVLFPGAADAIRRACEAMPIAIASGARGDEIRRVLIREGLSNCFTAIVAAEDTPVSKPAPDPYLRALALLAPALGDRLEAAHCVAIEDSHWGLESARNAGMRTVAVTNTYAADLLSADLTISSLRDMDLDLLGRLCSS